MQLTPARSRAATSLVVLGFGAGIAAPEYRLVTGWHVVERDRLVCARIEGRWPREVPVIRR